MIIKILTVHLDEVNDHVVASGEPKSEEATALYRSLIEIGAIVIGIHPDYTLLQLRQYVPVQGFIDEGAADGRYFVYEFQDDGSNAYVDVRGQAFFEMQFQGAAIKFEKPDIVYPIWMLRP